MVALLDTHVLLWWALARRELSSRVTAVLSDGGNRLLWSAASTWEVALKLALGRLVLGEPLERFLPRYLGEQGIESLPVTNAHAFRVAVLPHHHRDPFDRMIVAQAQVEGVPILSRNGLLAAYGVEVIW